MRRSVAHTNLVELAAPVFVRSGGPEREDSWNNELLAAYLIQRPASPAGAAEKESLRRSCQVIVEQCSRVGIIMMVACVS